LSDKNKVEKKHRQPTARFSDIAAVAPQKRQYKFESLYPATMIAIATILPNSQHDIRSYSFHISL